MADQCKLRQNVGLENMNMTSNYDVTNNVYQIQMAPYATEWNPPHENFLRTPMLLSIGGFLKRQIADK